MLSLEGGWRGVASPKPTFPTGWGGIVSRGGCALSGNGGLFAALEILLERGVIKKYLHSSFLIPERRRKIRKPLFAKNCRISISQSHEFFPPPPPPKTGHE